VRVRLSYSTGRVHRVIVFQRNWRGGDDWNVQDAGLHDENIQWKDCKTRCGGKRENRRPPDNGRIHKQRGDIRTVHHGLFGPGRFGLGRSTAYRQIWVGGFIRANSERKSRVYFKISFWLLFVFQVFYRRRYNGTIPVQRQQNHGGGQLSGP